MITRIEREQVAQRIRAQRERRAERSLVRDEILESRGRDPSQARQLEIAAQATVLDRNELGLRGPALRASLQRERDLRSAALALREGRGAWAPSGSGERLTTTLVVVTTPVATTPRPTGPADGQALTGYAALSHSQNASLSVTEGLFIETIEPGAFRRSIAARMPILMFEHGRHPMIGTMPIGSFQELREDNHGLYVRARLFENFLVGPLRDALQGRAITGMSFRFDVVRDRWHQPRRPSPRILISCPSGCCRKSRFTSWDRSCFPPTQVQRSRSARSD